MAGFFARVGLIAGVVGVVTFSAKAAPATQPTDQTDLQSQVNELRAEVAELKAERTAPSTQPSQAQIDDEIKSVIADADSHSKMLDSIGDDTNAGYFNRRFFIQSDDGDFTLRPWIHIEVRDDTNYTYGNYDIQNGLEIRRARLGFDGNLFGKNLTYFINWATNRANSSLTVKSTTGATVGTTTSPVGGLPVLEEAWLKYNFDETPWFIHVGQMHDPLDHENIVGSKYRAPEASLQGDLFGNTDTFTQAATLIYDPHEAFRVEAGINHGIRGANTNFEDAGNNGNAYNGGLAGRVEWKLMGNWKDYDQLTSLNDKSDLLVLGSGMDYSYGLGGYYTLSHTVDLQYADPMGWFAYLCYFGRYTNHQMGIPNTSNPGASFGTPGDPGQDTYEPSVDAELAYLIDGRIEPFIRYEYMHLAGTPTGSQNNVTDISLGMNYYFYGHNLKFTGLGTYLPTGIPLSDTSGDVLISNGKGEVVFITQIQLLL